MDWIPRYDYSEMIEKYFEEMENKNVITSDNVYIIRGMTEIVFDKFTKEPVIYTPIIEYYRNLNNIPTGEKYEQMKSSDFIDEMVNIHSFE